MKALICTSCGASKWKEEGEYRVCLHCGTKFEKTFEDRARIVVSGFQPSVERHDDVARLLQKCRSDPRNARKYANLILDIDPINEEALKYLR